MLGNVWATSVSCSVLWWMKKLGGLQEGELGFWRRAMSCRRASKGTICLPTPLTFFRLHSYSWDL